MVFLCLAMSVMLFVKVYMAIVIILVKLFRKRPEWRYIWEPMREKDELIVQIPMYNEKEVYQLSIGAACRQSWTSDRIIIQVLDDSTDSVIKVPSVNRLGVAGAMAQAVTDNPLASVEGESSEGEGKKLVWKKSNNDMEQQVVKLMEEFVGAAMQFLQSKALCVMPIFLATMIYQSHHQNEIPEVKLEPNAPS